MNSAKKSPVRETQGQSQDNLSDSMRLYHGISVVVPPDGKYHRFNDKGRSGGPIWAFFDGLNAVHGDWRTGESHVITNEDIDPAKAAEARRRADEAKLRHDQERKEKQAQVAAQCRDEWPMLVPADPKHPYLVAKQVRPHNLRQKGSLLIVPMSDGERLVNWQEISPNGFKKFHPGGEVTACYSPIGEVGETLLVCEGWATGAALHEATGFAVACAMNAGNLLPVCESFRRRYPSQAIVIAADNDHVKEAQGKGNAGLTKAREAARFIGAGIIFPPFKEGDQGTDYNDWLRAGGEVGL